MRLINVFHSEKTKKRQYARGNRMKEISFINLYSVNSNCHLPPSGSKHVLNFD